jgi:PRC-barrel domain protein
MSKTSDTVRKASTVYRRGRKGDPVNLIRLERHQHPSPPRHELRNRGVYASTGRYLGHVADLYVDDDRKLRFVDVMTGGLLGLGRKHHLIPAEAITEQALNAVTLEVDEETVEGAPTIPNPLAGPDEYHQRALYEHYGYPSPG